MSIYGSGAAAAPSSSIYGNGDIYRSGTEGGGIYGSGVGGGGLYDLPQQEHHQPPLSPGSASTGTSSDGTYPTAISAPHRQPQQHNVVASGGGKPVSISRGSTTIGTPTDSSSMDGAIPPPKVGGFGEIDSLSSLDVADMELQMDALEEHHSIKDVNSIIYEVGTTEATMAMVIAYTESNILALLGMKPSQVNANVLWSATGTANMCPTITHAVLSVPQSGAKDKPDFYAKMSAHLIKSMRELGADVSFTDSSGVTARDYALRHNVHRIVIDALETKDTTVRKETPYPPHDEGCWCVMC